jgi:hypothetical protein
MAREMGPEFSGHAAPLIAAGEADPGTVFGFPCLRFRGQFVAMPYHGGRGMVAKLPRGRVTALITDGLGRPFAPAGKAFREWVHIPEYDAALWDAVLLEARAFAQEVTHAKDRNR